jgi:hypothetical protein
LQHALLSLATWPRKGAACTPLSVSWSSRTSCTPSAFGAQAQWWCAPSGVT